MSSTRSSSAVAPVPDAAAEFGVPPRESATTGAAVALLMPGGVEGELLVVLVPAGVVLLVPTGVVFATPAPAGILLIVVAMFFRVGVLLQIRFYEPDCSAVMAQQRAFQPDSNLSNVSND